MTYNAKRIDLRGEIRPDYNHCNVAYAMSCPTIACNDTGLGMAL